MTGPEVARRWRPGWPIDLAATLRPLRRGRGDPAYAVADDGALWLTARTPDGPATQRLSVDRPAGEVVLAAWGPGAAWAADRLPAALGAGDDPTGFDPAGLPAPLREAWRRLGPRWRVPAGGRVLEVLVPAVLEQKVTGIEARRAWRALLRAYGEPAPGPAPEGMRVFPEPGVLRSVPSWDWHRFGVEGVRSATVLRAAAVAPRLEECVGLPADEARARLTSLPGVGVWTAAEVAQRALGDADAVSFGDFHIPRTLVHTFTGETDGDDERMRELLAPYAGHRYRVQRLVEEAGVAPPARGPRLAPKDHRRH